MLDAGVFVLLSLIVLIETYWNVNEYKIPEDAADNSVLIETYWNVNNCGATSKKNSMQVLIETYWNVNTSRQLAV